MTAVPLFSEKIVYLSMSALGAVVPYIPFFRWLRDQSFDWHLPGRFLAELFSTHIGAFFGLDVILSAVTLFMLMLFERRSHPKTRLWPAILATLLAGVSCGLPLYLYERERTREIAA